MLSALRRAVVDRANHVVLEQHKGQSAAIEVATGGYSTPAQRGSCRGECLAYAKTIRDRETARQRDSKTARHSDRKRNRESETGTHITRETKRQGGSGKGRQRDRETEGQRDRETERRYILAAGGRC